MLLYHFDNLPMNSSERPGLVHRIDKDTPGLLVLKRSCDVTSAKQFEAKTSEREYGACGVNVVAESGTIEGNVARHVKDRMQMAVLLILR
jgi:23S rRNA pseudouridine1911/1915/1917 synthase